MDFAVKRSARHDTVLAAVGLCAGLLACGAKDARAAFGAPVVLVDNNTQHQAFVEWMAPFLAPGVLVMTPNWRWSIAPGDPDMDGAIDDLVFGASHLSDPPPHPAPDPPGEITPNPMDGINGIDAAMLLPAPAPPMAIGPILVATEHPSHGHVDWLQVQFNAIAGGAWRISIQLDHTNGPEKGPTSIPEGGFIPAPGALALFMTGGFFALHRRR